jgi:hypothetical protein
VGTSATILFPAADHLLTETKPAIDAVGKGDAGLLKSRSGQHHQAPEFVLVHVTDSVDDLSIE